jgi:iron(III) transport system substrate-binding protein
MIKKIVLFLFFFISLSNVFAKGNMEELNVYSLMPTVYSSQITSDFSNETGIKVNLKEVETDELISILEEDDWGDVILGGLGMDHQIFSESNFLAKIDKQKGINEDLFGSGSNNQWISININSLVFLSNNKFLETNGLSIPAEWSDILYPTYKDEIVLSNPVVDSRIGRIYNLELLYGEEGSIKFQMALDKNVRNYTRDTSSAVSLVESGEVGFTITDSAAALDAANSGAPVTISFPKEGVIYGETACSVIKDCKNYKNAKTFIDWLLSDSYLNCIKNNKIPYISPIGIESYKDEFIDFSKVNFLKTDFAWKLENKDKFIEDFDNFILKNRQ